MISRSVCVCGLCVGLGGTCVNVGCIPKKLMHQTALLREFYQVPLRRTAFLCLVVLDLPACLTWLNLVCRMGVRTLLKLAITDSVSHYYHRVAPSCCH